MDVQNVLFLCNHNAARSIMAEAILNDLAGDRFRAYSAGLAPGDGPHPLALETLRRHGHAVDGLRSKAAAAFAGEGAAPLHFVITLCDSAAREICPDWPGQPEIARWWLPNPAAVEGDLETRREAFETLYTALRSGLRLFAADDRRSLQRMALAS